MSKNVSLESLLGLSSFLSDYPSTIVLGIVLGIRMSNWGTMYSNSQVVTSNHLKIQTLKNILRASLV